jgi:hypothetical protein
MGLNTAEVRQGEGCWCLYRPCPVLLAAVSPEVIFIYSYGIQFLLLKKGDKLFILQGL